MLSDGSLDVLKEAIDMANKELAKSQREYIYLPPIWGTIVAASFKTGNGTVGKFSTMALRGDDQTFIQQDYDGYSVLNLDLLLGLDELKLHYDFEYRLLLIKKRGSVVISTNTDSLRAKITIVSRDDGNCTAVLNSAQITDLGKYEISITPTNLMRKIRVAIEKFIANQVMPLALPALNKALDLIVKDVVPLTDFSKLACQPFVY